MRADKCPMEIEERKPKTGIPASSGEVV